MCYNTFRSTRIEILKHQEQEQEQGKEAEKNNKLLKQKTLDGR